MRLIPLLAAALCSSFAVANASTEVAAKQDAFSKFTVEYTLDCGEPNTVSTIQLSTEQQSRSLVYGREDQKITFFGYGPLKLKVPVSDVLCVSIQVLSVEPVTFDPPTVD